MNIRAPRKIPELTARGMRRWHRYIWRGPETDCWIWIGARTLDGYGQIRIAGHVSKFLAHRVGYVHRYGPIKNRGVLMHTCDNPGCVNPEHLRPGTYRRNTWDMIEKGRQRGVVEVVRECPY